jgi:endonuclease YncB( thermonuclease family)
MKFPKPEGGKPAQLILLVVVASCFIFLPTHVSGKDVLQARVLSVTDGDTIVVQAGGETKVVRLIGVDCPELGKKGEPGEFMAQEVKEFVIGLIDGKEVQLEFDMETEDRYGRWLCYVYHKEGEMLNAVLVQRGLALTLKYFPFREKSKFMELEREAQREGRGLFQEGSAKALEYVTTHYRPVHVYEGPAHSFIIVYRGMGKPWLSEGGVAEEIERMRRYRRQYSPPMLERALQTDGYVHLKEIGTAGDKNDPVKIDYRDAHAFAGRYVIIEGEIVRTKNTGKVTFLDFDKDWKNNLSIVIFSRDARKFPEPPEKLYLGKTIRIEGKIKIYKGRPEIVLSDPRSIKVMQNP